MSGGSKTNLRMVWGQGYCNGNRAKVTFGDQATHNRSAMSTQETKLVTWMRTDILTRKLLKGPDSQTCAEMKPERGYQVRMVRAIKDCLCPQGPDRLRQPYVRDRQIYWEYTHIMTSLQTSS